MEKKLRNISVRFLIAGLMLTIGYFIGLSIDPIEKVLSFMDKLVFQGLAFFIFPLIGAVLLIAGFVVSIVTRVKYSKNEQVSLAMNKCIFIYVIVIAFITYEVVAFVTYDLGDFINGIFQT